jgi:hypothetical protein
VNRTRAAGDRGFSRETLTISPLCTHLVMNSICSHSPKRLPLRSTLPWNIRPPSSSWSPAIATGAINWYFSIAKYDPATHVESPDVPEDYIRSCFPVGFESPMLTPSDSATVAELDVGSGCVELAPLVVVSPPGPGDDVKRPSVNLSVNRK